MPANPYDQLPSLPALTVTSSTVADGQFLESDQLSGKFGIPHGKDISPDLHWSGAPTDTQSFTVTVYDPDAPTVSGFWHWAVYNIPASIDSLPLNAGSDASLLPKEAITLTNDAGFAGFVGAAPPPGHGPHRYIFAVHAVNTVLDLPAHATPAYLGFNLFSTAIARGLLTSIYGIPS